MVVATTIVKQSSLLKHTSTSSLPLKKRRIKQNLVRWTSSPPPTRLTVETLDGLACLAEAAGCIDNIVTDTDSTSSSSRSGSDADHLAEHDSPCPALPRPDLVLIHTHRRSMAAILSKPQVISFPLKGRDFFTDEAETMKKILQPRAPIRKASIPAAKWESPPASPRKLSVTESMNSLKSTSVHSSALKDLDQNERQRTYKLMLYHAFLQAQTSTR